ncbi:MAG: hypothetical protein GY722_20970 [bacterium]|nr:hypothetical protein [bacterium]
MADAANSALLPGGGRIHLTRGSLSEVPVHLALQNLEGIFESPLHRFEQEVICWLPAV